MVGRYHGPLGASSINSFWATSMLQSTHGNLSSILAGTGGTSAGSCKLFKAAFAAAGEGEYVFSGEGPCG